MSHSIETKKKENVIPEKFFGNLSLISAEQQSVAAFAIHLEFFK